MPAHDDPTEFDRLLALRETGLLDGPPSPGFEEICQEARDRLAVPVALVTLVDHDRLVVAAGASMDPSPRSDAFCDHTIRSDGLLVVPDLSRDARFDRNPLVIGGPRFRFYAGAPLIYGRSLRLGALCVLDTRPRDFSPGDRAELAELADRVVALIGETQFASLPGPVPR